MKYLFLLFLTFMAGCQTIYEPTGVVYKANESVAPDAFNRLAHGVSTITIFNNNVIVFDSSLSPEYPDVYTSVLPEKAVAELIAKLEYMVYMKQVNKFYIYDQPVQ